MKKPFFSLSPLPPQGGGGERGLDVRDKRLEALRLLVSSSVLLLLLLLLLLLRRRRRRRRKSRGHRRGGAAGSFPPRLLLLLVLLLPAPGRLLELERALALVEDEGSSAVGFRRRRRRRRRRVAGAAPAKKVFSVFSLFFSSSFSFFFSSSSRPLNFSNCSRRGPAHARPLRRPQPRLGALGPPPRLRQRVQRGAEPPAELGGLPLARRRRGRRRRGEALVVGREVEAAAEQAGDFRLVRRGEVAEVGRADDDGEGLPLAGLFLVICC